MPAAHAPAASTASVAGSGTDFVPPPPLPGGGGQSHAPIIGRLQNPPPVPLAYAGDAPRTPSEAIARAVQTIFFMGDSTPFSVWPCKARATGTSY